MYLIVAVWSDKSATPPFEFTRKFGLNVLKFEKYTSINFDHQRCPSAETAQGVCK